MARITYIDTSSPRSRQRSGTGQLMDGKGSRRCLVSWLLRYRIPLLLFMALYRFIGLGSGEMQQWDEAIYALRSQVILQFGAVWDQSAEMLSGMYYAAHPPLYVWLSTSTLLLFGDELWAYRLPSAIAGALLVPLLYRLSRLTQSTIRSLVVTGLFAFAPLPALYSRLGQLDLLLTAGMMAALYFALLALRSGKRVDVLLAGVALGCALMTKLFFALAIPAGVGAAAVLLSGEMRKRAFLVAIAMTLISLPLWVPWAWSFAVTHGDGPAFLFSRSLPFGATIAGLEGGAKDTGSWYYLNQLIVHLSILFPFAAVSLFEAFRAPRRSEWLTTSMVVFLILAALWSMQSTFEVYLIPVLPLLVLHAVRGVGIVRRRSRLTMLIVTLTAALSLTWSVSHDWRVAVKDMLRVLTGIQTDVDLLSLLLLTVMCVVTVALVVWLWRRQRLSQLFSLPLTGGTVVVFALVTCIRLWVFVPVDFNDGALQATTVVRSSNASRIFLVGGGDNPQLTFYLNGADIGWAEEEKMRYERLDPRALGVNGIRARIAAQQRHGAVAVLVERDEIALGMYDRVRDVLPPSFPVLLRSGRYAVAGNDELRLAGKDAAE
ncbi:MAG: glycosyltransferase family 39 protein [Bacteroidetes bacterium]|nr:glycosyltransferase family 39 protein [Bacteroidota bacterium]